MSFSLKEVEYGKTIFKKGGGYMSCPHYTLSKEFPLKLEQNEMIDFAIRRPNAVISGQT